MSPDKRHSIGDAVVAVDLAGNVSFMNPAAEAVIGVAADLARAPTENSLLPRQLELADRLASLGSMAAGVAHEVNNPLAVVLANGSYVLEELQRLAATGAGDPHRLAEAIQAQSDLESAAHRIALIITDLQAFARPEHSVEGESDVGAVVEWAVRSTAHDHRYRAKVVTDIAPVPMVEIDETRLAQVLVNLMTNAAQAIAPGDVGNNTIGIAVTAADHSVVLEVRDTGCGMAPEVLKRVFEPFYTTRPAGQGTGLGLSICQGIVSSVGGRVDVESQEGRGSTFRITLPAVRDVASAATLTAPVPAPVGTQERGSCS